MRIAVISDVHANEPALTAVLEDVDAESPDEIWCLGDVVGYGAAPNECCLVVAERADLCLVGNHDLVALGTLDVDEFNEEAAAAALWTRRQLDEASRSFLASLDSTATRDGVDLFHASPRDPVWEYVLSADVAHLSLLASAAPIVLVGHSHVALAVGLDADGLHGGPAPQGTELELDGRWLLNPGAVGQPRDGDRRGAWLLLDLDESTASFRRVEYDVVAAQTAIRAAGLPEGLADRLGYGV